MSRPYTRFVQAAAFFDLDRTLLRRSSALALAGAFREHGVIGRGQLAKAAAWQLFFAARGASAETVRKAAEDGLMILKGFAVDDLRALVAGAMEPVLKPLVYQEALELARGHQERGEPIYIVSATLQEIVEEIAQELGFDGAIGSTCEIEDGVYTGRSLRAAHGKGKAAAVRELAEEHGYDLTASTAYSDSHTDLPFLEAVGNPVVVNPDRELRGIAEERDWPVREFGELAYPLGRRVVSPALLGIPLVLGAGAAVLGVATPCGLSDADRGARLLRGRHRHADVALPRRRVEREARPRALPGRLARDAAGSAAGREPTAAACRRRLRALGRERRARLPDAGRDRRRAAGRASRPRPRRSSPRTASRPGCSAGTSAGSQRAASSRH